MERRCRLVSWTDQWEQTSVVGVKKRHRTVLKWPSRQCAATYKSMTYKTLPAAAAAVTVESTNRLTAAKPEET